MLGDRLKESRKQAGLTQEELATLVGVHPLTISHFETGRVVPSLDTLKRLAAALGVQPGVLLDEPAESPAEGAA